MDLNELKKNWEQLGEADPFYAILRYRSKTAGNWDLKEFFDTGTKDVEGIMSKMDSSGVLSRRPQRALDFGCGVGRLTQPLGARFEEVVGVDISSSMVGLANKLNTALNCKFLINERSDLSLFPDGHFDFILSLITLQHMQPKYVKSYLREFMRVLSRGGVAYFGIPDRRKGSLYGRAKDRMFGWLIAHRYLDSPYRILRHRSEPVMEMYGVKKNEITSLMKSTGGEVISIEESQDGGPNWLSYHYCIKKT